MGTNLGNNQMDEQLQSLPSFGISILFQIEKIRTILDIG